MGFKRAASGAMAPRSEHFETSKCAISELTLQQVHARCLYRKTTIVARL